MTVQSQPISLEGAKTELLRRDEGGVAFLTLNRPQARNALSAALMTRLEENLAAIAGDGGQVFLQPSHQRCREGVARLRPVERQKRDAALVAAQQLRFRPFEGDRLGLHGHDGLSLIVQRQYVARSRRWFQRLFERTESIRERRRKSLTWR